ncbi:hypothetical protein KORDIASMS9_04408 [Kordia sp. SMS9]|nr:hypothetical protein KORDIASMS9_00223 [Kordia sp. SMS9]AXG72140.1 hypothetical protein KORDIASMS9_04408 [Kordia sp. SMS9]
MNYFLFYFTNFLPKAGANIKPFFLSNKTFLRFFLKLFRKLLASHLKVYFLSELIPKSLPILADANIQPFLVSNKILI